MSASSLPRVTDAHGAAGRLDLDASDAEGMARVHLSDGSTARVPRGRLQQTDDGSYRLDGAFERVASEVHADAGRVVEEETVPLVEEEVRVRKKQRETGRVRIKKHVREHTETVDEALLREEVEVERVPINTVIAEPAAIREDGDTTIIPIVEERLVVKKELVLVEELHVRRTRTEHRAPQEVTLRREEAEVERVDLDNDDARRADQQHDDAARRGSTA